MSVGNTKDKGNNFGNNFPFQIAMLKLLGTIATNTTGAGQDYELITYNYKANKNGAGYSTGNLITRTQIVFVPTGNIISTLWFNQSTGLTIAPPPIADIDAVLPATAVTVNNLPTVLGQALMINSLAVTIASDQSAIPVTQAAVARVPSVVSAVANGSTTAGVRSVTLWFRGANGTLNGVGIPNNGIVTFKADGQNDTLNALPFTVPTTGEARIIITYTT